MRKEVARRIVNLIRDEISNPHNNRGSPISPEVQTLSAIRYLAKGAYEQDVSEQHGLSQPSLSLIIKRVVEAIASHINEFITFSQGNEALRTKEEFFNIANCPNIIGAIDCTHCKIKNPGGDNPLTFINRKGLYSLNVQVVCDAKCRIRHIVARWRGSTHDSRIWNECPLKRQFENGEIDGILVGDNGYASSRYMLTPLLNPRTNAEVCYNRAHILTRNVIERVFGIMKNKFRCFFNGLHLNINTTKAAIVAIAILHNIILNDRLENEDISDDDDNFDEDNQNEVHRQINVPENITGNLFRQQYIQRHFN